MALLTAEDLTIGYDQNVVLKNVNFHVDVGDYLCIVGENGAGKSTLMKTLLGLLEPKGGSISFGDGLSKNEIGYLPQQTVVQKDFPASVGEIVLSGCQSKIGMRPFYSKEDKRLAQEKMEQMQILDFKKRCYRELSGGQQQRVLLARALCATGKLLLMDEPVAGLDPLVTAEMYELITGLHEEGIAIIMISHDIEAALEHATHILHIGSELFYGTKEEYMNSSIGRLFLTKQNTEKHFAQMLAGNGLGNDEGGSGNEAGVGEDQKEVRNG